MAFFRMLPRMKNGIATAAHMKWLGSCLNSSQFLGNFSPKKRQIQCNRWKFYSSVSSEIHTPITSPDSPLIKNLNDSFPNDSIIGNRDDIDSSHKNTLSFKKPMTTEMDGHYQSPPPFLPLTIYDILVDPKLSELVHTQGWIRTIRIQKNVAFAELTDGSQLEGLQLVFSNPDLVKGLTTGTAVQLSGTLIESQGKNQLFDFVVNSIETIGNICPESYPLQKKFQSSEYLRSIAHLRPRTKHSQAIFRIRHIALKAFHDLFHQWKFTLIPTPIITEHDCEGGGEMFSINMSKHKSESSSKEQEFFFGKNAFLTVSGQLHLECASVGAFSRVYTIAPAFRAENSNTHRHLSEFWMLEAELAFTKNLDQLLLMIDELLKTVIEKILRDCYQELIFLQTYSLKSYMTTDSKHLKFSFSENNNDKNTLLGRLKTFVETPLKRMSYSEAIHCLEKASMINTLREKEKIPFSDPITSWGQVLGNEHEQYLVKRIFNNEPVFITDFPMDQKPFYMRSNDDNRTVANVDLILPEFGELLGGSLREERYDFLLDRMRIMKTFHSNERSKNDNNDYLDMKNSDNDNEMDSQSHLSWYLDIRKYGGVPHGGFGLGLERFIQFCTGVHNIRDVTLMHRSAGSLHF